MSKNGKLIFAANAEERDEIAKKDGVYCVRHIEEVSGMLRHLKEGGTAVGSLEGLALGYNLPLGTEVEFTDSCPIDGPERIQAEARVGRVGRPSLYPHQQEAMDALGYHRPEHLAALQSKTAAALSSGLDPQQHAGRIFRPGQRKTSTPEIVMLTDLEAIGERIEASFPEKSAPSGGMDILAEAHHVKDPFAGAAEAQPVRDDLEP